MCGITGVFDLREQRTINRDVLARVNDMQRHRGPDEGGLHLEPGLGLGHRRLSIIDIASGQQPLFNEDGSVAVVFNGEIYNFVELIPELTALGHTFKTRSDTETIVHAWEQWGEDCVHHFRGMFAFALWDRNKQSLFLARDRLGVKPLYYAVTDDGYLVFGSELKAITAWPGFRRQLDDHAVEEYFSYGYVPEPRTIYSTALKMPPGHRLLIKRGAAVGQPREYWDVPFQPLPALSLEAAEDELIERLREAVKIRMISEVPLGAFLSGGVDSSAVVAMMAGLNEQNGGQPVKTCSIAFSDPKYNEAGYARQVAERYRTDHHVESVEADDFSLVDELAHLYDEPYADSSAMPTYRVCQLARKTVTVALSGDGGDENFAGYRRYRWHSYEERMRRVLPHGIRKPLFGGLGALYPKADWAPKVLRAKTTFEAMARDTVEGYFHGVSLMGNSLRERVFSREFKRRLNGYSAVEVLRRHHARNPARDMVSQVQYLDMKTYMVGDILTKVDRASMAHALEVRVPFLDHKLMEWVSGLPVDFKLRGGEGKFMLKRALEPYLPHDIMYRRKMGFSIPVAEWFRGPLREKLASALQSQRMADTGLFDMAYLMRMADEHARGVRDYSASLWALLMFDAFLRNQEIQP
ncbi:MAG: amidotransferase 1, exosortase A system-associated [Pseudomonadota bacterium]|nr:amidotransferase 1, exosortase A system-associated [Pseudomonadota bacterium]MDP1903290.1 amidotransferase 1, exosortase A system-associated [Pseudomonadota bacterium]MDP2353386.1 amidotransferase 1, exosortase A system-associated [Pseudomonadota bacterium]